MALAAAEPYPLALDVELRGLDIRIAGTVADVTRARGIEVQLQVHSPSLREAVQAWNNLELPFDVEVTANGRLTGELAALSLADIDAEIAGSRGDRLQFGGSLANVMQGSGLDGRLTANLGPQGALIRALPEEWHIAKTAEVSARVTGSLKAPVFDEVSADVGGLGESRMTIAGAVRLSDTPTAKLESFDLAATFDVPDASVFADRLGFDPSVFGPWSGAADLSLADRRIEATNMRADAVEFGGLRVTGEGIIGTTDVNGVPDFRPAVSLSAHMAESTPLLRLVGTDLPELGPVQAAGRLSRDAQGYRLDEFELDLGTPDRLTVAAHGKVGPLVASDAKASEIDIAVDLRWPSSEVLSQLTGRDLPELGQGEGRFTLAGTIADISLRDASLSTRNDAGLVLTATGEAAHVSTSKPFVFGGVALDLTAEAPSTTVPAQLLGYEVPDLGQVRGSAKLKDEDGTMALTDIRLLAGSVEAPIVEVSGSINNVVALEQVGLDGKLDMPSHDLLALVGLGGERDLGRIRGEARLSDAKGPLSVEHFAAQMSETDLLTLSVEGLIDDLDDIDLVEVQASVRVPNVTDLGAALGANLARLGAFRFDGKLSGDGQRFNADGQAVLGDTHVEGVLAGDITGARPMFEGSLRSPLVRMADFGVTALQLEEALREEREPRAPDTRLFPDKPLPLDGLRKFDFDLEVDVDGIEGVLLAVDRASGRASLKDGRLLLSTLEFETAGGRAVANGELDLGAPAPRWQLHSESDDLELGHLWRELEFEVPLSGELDLQLDLQATGGSPRAIASSLDGDVGVAVQRGQLQTSLFYLTTTNPIRWLGTGSTRRGFAEVNCLVARFHLDDGFAKADALVLDTPNAVAVGEGHIDLHKEVLDLRIRPSPKRRRIANLTTPFAIRGDLASPSIDVSTTGAATRMVGEVALSPVNVLGSLIPFVGDRGRDRDNPCLTLTGAAVEP